MKKIAVNINFPTGNMFPDGTAEVGKIVEIEVNSVDQLSDEIDRVVNDGDDYFLTVGGKEVTEYDICQMFEEEE